MSVNVNECGYLARNDDNDEPVVNLRRFTQGVRAPVHLEAARLMTVLA